MCDNCSKVPGSVKLTGLIALALGVGGCAVLFKSWLDRNKLEYVEPESEESEEDGDSECVEKKSCKFKLKISTE